MQSITQAISAAGGASSSRTELNANEGRQPVVGIIGMGDVSISACSFNFSGPIQAAFDLANEV